MNNAGGADYTRVSEDLTFVANSATNTKMEFTFPIIDDNLHEGNESVVLKGLSLCNNETFAGKATVIIIDDDGKWYCCLPHYEVLSETLIQRR